MTADTLVRFAALGCGWVPLTCAEQVDAIPDIVWGWRAALLLVLVGPVFIVSKFIYSSVTFWLFPTATSVAGRIDRKWANALKGRIGPTVPLFAVAAVVPDGALGRQDSALPQTMLIPFGISRPAALMAIATGGLITSALIVASPAMGTAWFPLAGPIILATYCGCWCLTFTLVHMPNHAPLDEHLRRVARSERPILIESVGLIPTRDSALGARMARLLARGVMTMWVAISMFALGAWYGFVPASMRPQRLRSLTDFRLQSVPRYLHCLGMGHVLLGPAEERSSSAGQFSNRAFLCLYFGHALVHYVLLVAAIILLAYNTRSEAIVEGKAAMQILVIALLYWWALVLSQANACHREMAMMRSDLMQTAHVAASSEEQDFRPLFLAMLETAKVSWIPALASVASATMLIAALTVVQALGNDPK